MLLNPTWAILKSLTHSLQQAYVLPRLLVVTCSGSFHDFSIVFFFQLSDIFTFVRFELGSESLLTKEIASSSQPLDPPAAYPELKASVVVQRTTVETHTRITHVWSLRNDVLSITVIYCY